MGKVLSFKKHFTRLTLIVILFLPSSIFGQVPIKILIGQTDKQVNEYFGSLKQFFASDKSVGIEQKTSANGDLILSFGTPINHEEITNSLEIIAHFVETRDGDEICTDQIIIGTEISAYKNVSTIRKLFSRVPDREGTWLRSFNEHFNEVAEFQKKDGLYTIKISLVSK